MISRIIIPIMLMLLPALPLQADPAPPQGVRLASNDKVKQRGAKAKRSRERHINRELKYSNKDKSSIDFESVEIGGETKSPLDGLIQSTKSEKGGNFVKIRTRWHPEMMSSASELGFAGSGRR